MSEWVPLLLGLAPTFANVFLGLAGLGVTLLTGWLAKKSKVEIVDKLIYRAGDYAYQAVGELNQTMVDQLKKAAADGKLSKDEATSAFNAAFTRVVAALGSKARQDLQRHLGSAEAFNNLLRTLIENAVRGQKPR